MKLTNLLYGHPINIHHKAHPVKKIITLIYVRHRQPAPTKSRLVPKPVTPRDLAIARKQAARQRLQSATALNLRRDSVTMVRTGTIFD
ncbi:MAG: hypothetical protein WD294_11575 [Phycisphaeraceae bacterium]